MPRLTNALLRRAAKAAEHHAALNQKVGEAFKERYGTTYSDVDADSIIDVLDYHGGEITVAECDDAMNFAGAPKLKKQRR